MTLVVEAGAENADSYATLDEIASYAAAHGLTFAASPAAPAEAAARVAAQWIDAKYGSRFTGWRTYGREQSRAWPRSGAYDAEEIDLDEDEIPQEVKDAQCEAAIREFAAAGTLAPDLDRGGSIRRMRAGSVEIEYGADASAGTVFSVIDGILSGLLGSGSAPSYAGFTERG